MNHRKEPNRNSKPRKSTNRRTRRSPAPAHNRTARRHGMTRGEFAATVFVKALDIFEKIAKAIAAALIIAELLG